MPELPEVQAVAERLRAAAPWARITGFGQFRPSTISGGAYAPGRRIESVGRRGKNLILRLSGGWFARVHLKMTGDLRVLPDARQRPQTVRAWFSLDDGRAVVLDDPRALGRISLHPEQEEPELFEDLGPEPFSPEFTPAALYASSRRTVRPAKIWLMDQATVAGLGNIYAAEALFEAGIDPRRPAARLSRQRVERLHAAILRVLETALASVRAAYERPGAFSEAGFYPVAVYGREGQPCRRCGAAVRRIPQGGRSTYYCPKCQK
ncbi:MAG: bifunctional DNA-formamidopyrimidine glycosylase/DNA-(apurinic or apyrimidinic site) lyase [Acidobacteriota bacterium]